MVISPVFPLHHHLGKFSSAAPASSLNSAGSEDVSSPALIPAGLAHYHPHLQEPLCLPLGLAHLCPLPTRLAIVRCLVGVQGLLFRMLQAVRGGTLMTPALMTPGSALPQVTGNQGGRGRGEGGGGHLSLANTTVLQTGSRASFPTLLPSGPAHPHLSQRGHLFYCAAGTRYLLFWVLQTVKGGGNSV